MKLFENIISYEKLFKAFSNDINSIYERIKKYPISEVEEIDKINNYFIKKTADYLRKDRKLNIGVIGQIKTGRSTFLNTLLFNSESVLPNAATPKTVTVTKILYSKENFIEVEYYTKKEWENILEDSEIENEENIARNILDMLKYRDIEVEEYIDKENDIIMLDTYSKIESSLNDYIGENGRLTPLVKSITININNKVLENLCVVDTPGINDPIQSRTARTKIYLETCDVVFFLSRSSQFLDNNDISTLSTLLPKKGVKKLVLVCSRYDDGLNDTLLDYDDLKTANLETKKQLFRHSQKIFRRLIDYYKTRMVSKDFMTMLESCSLPIFVSTMAYNMSNKFLEDYNASEMKVYRNLNYFNDLTPEVLREIGNFDEIFEEYENIAKRKEETLIKKYKSFIPDTKEFLKTELININNTIEKRITLLRTMDKRRISLQKEITIEQSKNIDKNIEEVFNELINDIKNNKDESMKDLEKKLIKASMLHEKEETEVISTTTTKDKAKWYNPFSWGEKEEKIISFEEKQTYLDVSEALDNIKYFVDAFSNEVFEMIKYSIRPDYIKRRLLKIIMENHDTSRENFDPFYFKLITIKTLREINFPEIDFDATETLKYVTEKFSGEVRNTSDKSSLKILLTYSLRDFFDAAKASLESKLNQFERQLNELKTKFYDTLIKNINKEYDLLIEQCENNYVEIENYKKALDEIDYCFDFLEKSKYELD